MKKLPAIVFDIDGVLKLGSKRLYGANSSIALLKSPTNDGTHIPFKLLSNGGGIHEATKAIDTNRTLQLQPPYQLNEKDLVLCHTPLQELLPDYKNKIILTAGVGDCHSVAVKYGFQKVIALEEYSALFPTLSRLSTFPYMH